MSKGKRIGKVGFWAAFVVTALFAVQGVAQESQSKANSVVHQDEASLSAKRQSCVEWMKLATNDEKALHPETQNLKSCNDVAVAGDAEIQLRLGVMYALGKGVAKNAEESKRLLLESAKQGHVIAQYEMVRAYMNGVLRNHGKYGARLDMIGAYGWMCVLEKQLENPDSLGLSIWNNPNSKHKETLKKAKILLEGVIKKHPISYGWTMKTTCKNMVKDYYKASSSATHSK